MAFLKKLSGLIANNDWWMVLLGVLDGRDAVEVPEDFIMSLVVRKVWFLRRYSGVDELPAA
jgi:hypothetical protein